MPNTIIITDSDSSLPAAMAQQWNIRQVPITIHFGSESFTTGVDIDDKSLFERIDRTGQLPTTSAPSPSAFAQAFQKAFDDGADSIVCICVSSRISSTYTSALTAREEFPEKHITVLDSLNLSMGQGFMALAAARAAAENLPHEEVVARAVSLSEHIQIFGYLSTLKYLAMGGRVSKITAGMANMLDIRPILCSQDGKLELLERVRTHRAAVDRLVEKVTGTSRGKSIQQVAFLHVNNLPGVEELVKRLRAEIQLPDDIIIIEFTPGLSVHTGSGLVGIVFITG